jgi:hypothetical protein
VSLAVNVVATPQSDCNTIEQQAGSVPMTNTETSSTPPSVPGASTPAQITWDEAAMQTAFANVVNVQSTREQFDLFFGTNKTWSPEPGSGVVVQLSSRVMLTPFAAKRLAHVLANVLTEYESRFGAIPLTP